MKKQYDMSNKARQGASWHKHLRPVEKRRVWKSNRKKTKEEIARIVDDFT